MIVLLGGEKGGTGKSTVAVNVAVYLARAGTDVILVDTDPQRTASQWVARRNKHQPKAPKIHCAEKTGGVYDTVKDLATRYDQVIVDAGGRDSEELRSAMVAADILYCPLKASQPDLETSVHMNTLVKMAKAMNRDLQSRLLISMAPTNPVINESDQARELLQELPQFELSNAIVRERKVFRDAMAEGLGILELNNPKASDEINMLGQEIYGSA